MALVMPLAAEEISDEKVWNHLANIVLSNENKIPQDAFLQNVSNLAWAFSKVEYKGDYAKAFWKFIERVYKSELDTLKHN